MFDSILWIQSKLYLQNILKTFFSIHFNSCNSHKAESFESDINNNTLLSKCYLRKKSVIGNNQKSTYSMHVTIENSDDPTLLYFSRRNGKKNSRIYTNIISVTLSAFN